MPRNVTAKTITGHLVLKNARLIDVINNRDEAADIVILDGQIESAGKSASVRGETIDLKGKVVTHGLMDMHVHLREPGREDKETILTGCNAAMAGGFTAVACMPNTSPAIDTPDTVQYIKLKAAEHLVDVYPIACVTKNREGKELAEFAGLVRAGAVAVSDDGEPVWNAEIMRRALEYVRMFSIPVINHPEDKTLSLKGSIHEGFTSTRLGLPGIPAPAEEVMVMRDIRLAEFTGSQVHLAHLSTARSIDLVREAKKRGIKVTCEVCPHHFTLTVEAVEGYNTNAKMNPPLREASDIEAILEGIKDGTIDTIASDHAPHTIDDKLCEFNIAAFGITGLETSLALTLDRLVRKNVITLADAIRKMSLAPRQILGLPLPEIKPGAPANLTIIDPDKIWTYEVGHTCSMSTNTPFHGHTFTGKATGVINKNRIFLEA